MPRPKYGNRKAKFSGSNFQGKSGLEPPSVISGHRNGFTLQEEAQHTARQQHFPGVDQCLRHTKVDFISAGAINPSKPEEPSTSMPNHTKSALADMSLGPPSSEEEMIIEVIEFDDGEGQKNFEEDVQQEVSLDIAPSPQKLSFVVDTIGSAPVQAFFGTPRVRSASPTPSCSSEEIILFAGRDIQGKPLPELPVTRVRTTKSIDKQIRVVEDKLHVRKALLEVSYDASSTSPGSVKAGKTSSTNLEPLLVTQERKQRFPRSVKQNEEDDLIADYIANMDQDLKSDPLFERRDLDDVEHDLFSTKHSFSPTVGASSLDQEGDDTLNFDDISTSDGDVGLNVREIISRRLRSSGLQYLVVWDKQATDEAKWVSVTRLSSVNAMVHVKKFESDQNIAASSHYHNAGMNKGSDRHSREGLDLDCGAVHRSEETYQHLKNDLAIAQLLARQEELGISSNSDSSSDGDVDEAELDDYIPLAMHDLPRSRFSRQVREKRHTRGEYPNATQLADAYDGFDVMDFERPSLKIRSKARRGKMEFYLSDSEIDECLTNSWKKDRAKKKQRKQERAELRAQGLLGSKNGKTDMKQKYKEGMGIYAIREEIKLFLMGGDTRLALPPMDKANRKVVHELANAVKLKSKSDGSGKKRFPVLYKTQQTQPFLEQAWDAAEARISRRFLPRTQAKGRNAIGTGRGGGGGFNNAAVSYRDGDIVGASAPELSAGNRGRAMLEKMGWTSGDALGAHNNKGILQPVSHVVKTTKAGLG